MRYTVASLDVIGNQNDGWEVNDQRQVGTLDITPEVFEEDQVLLDMLIAAEYIDASTTIENVYFMGHDFAYLALHDDDTDRPLLALILEQ
jgi:hypothetical protein